MRKHSRTPKAKLKRLLDYLAGTIVILRDKVCVICNKPAYASHHIMAKGKSSNTRYDLQNLIGICLYHHSWGVHQDAERYRQQVIDFVEKAHGKGSFEKLKIRAMARGSLKTPDLLLEEIYLLGELKRYVPDFSKVEWQRWSDSKKMQELKELREARWRL